MLKRYQEECLNALSKFLQDCAISGDIHGSYGEASQHHFGYPGVYNDAGFTVPYVCLRLPTGGGKTLLAAHTIPLVFKEFLARDLSLVIWLVPSNTILEQTYNSLQNPSHPYRRVLDEAFSGSVEVMKVENALGISKGTLETNTVLIISTFASWRVDKTEGRKVYESNGSLQSHFDFLSREQKEQLEHFEDAASRSLKYSLANLVYLHNPVFIIDEAHNARTELTFEVLKRLNPSCIVEYTATPKVKGYDRSNVLYSVSAASLKAEYMIKLPIELISTEEWQIVVGDAIAKQRELEIRAKEEELLTGEYIRPIVLIQAQNDSEKEQTISVEVVKNFLLNSCNVAGTEIAVATGSVREIEGIDLTDPKCCIRFIITKQALKEGWDCPFAYIFCSVAPVSSNKDAEQLIGRVLRMPNVKPKKMEDLNKAYAFVSSPRFSETLNSLTEYLGNIGFRAGQISDLITIRSASPTFEDYFGNLKVRLSSKLESENIEQSLQSKVVFDSSDNSLIFLNKITSFEKETLCSLVLEATDKENIEKAYQELLARESRKSPSQKGEVFKVPQLFIEFGLESRLFDEEVLIRKDWNLAKCDHRLSEVEFPVKFNVANASLIDIDGHGNIFASNSHQIQEELGKLVLSSSMRREDLIAWLVTECRHVSIIPAQIIVFITKTIDYLLNERYLEIDHLVFKRFRLRSALRSKIQNHFSAAKKEAFTNLLFVDDNGTSEPGKLKLGGDFNFPHDYPANSWYEGQIHFSKHYHQDIADMNGEETECALNIDSHPDVKFWIRNLERTEKYAFWLQTSTDKFYPDFVVELLDGTIVIVEYKRPDLYETPDSAEKRAIGEYYQTVSNAKCRFIMLKGKEWQKLYNMLTITKDRNYRP